MTYRLAIALLAITACSDLDASPTTWSRSLATQYGQRGDKWAGSVFACGGGKMDPRRWGIANRTLPCGTIVQVCNGQLCVHVPVVDRGPYWAVPIGCAPKYAYRCWRKGRSVVRARLRYSTGLRYINDLDLLPRVSRAIGLGGMGVVRWRVVSVPRRRK